MKEKHIIEILDGASLANLTKSEMETIRAHTKNCQECSRAFEAAQVSALMIKERVEETIEPSPFFHTRVMAAIRERKAAEVSAFKRLWDAAGSFVYSMTAAVAVLVAVTFFSFGFQTESTTTQDSFAQYSAEEVLLTEESAASDEQLTDEEIFSAIYEQ